MMSLSWSDQRNAFGVVLAHSRSKNGVASLAYGGDDVCRVDPD